MSLEQIEKNIANSLVSRAEEVAKLRAHIERLEESLWDIQEFTRGYGDIAGIVHRKARAALTPSDGDGNGN